MTRLMAGLVMLAMCTGCAGMSDSLRRLDDTMFAYERSLRWGNYDAAYAAHKPEKAELSAGERQRLQRIRVTSYRVLHTKMEDKEDRVNQLVALRYYNEDYALERSLELELKWEKDAASGRWLLNNPFPKFK